MGEINYPEKELKMITMLSKHQYSLTMYETAIFQSWKNELHKEIARVYGIPLSCVVGNCCKTATKVRVDNEVK